jgi:predicted RecA/RadA family phage recombinase
MAANFIQVGSVLDLTVVDNTDATDIASGEGYLAGSIFGVAIADVAVGASGPFQVDGVWSLPKATPQAWSQGAPIYWDNAAKKVTTVSGGNKLIGVATEAAGSNYAKGSVRLNGSFA